MKMDELESGLKLQARIEELDQKLAWLAEAGRFEVTAVVMDRQGHDDSHRSIIRADFKHDAWCQLSRTVLVPIIRQYLLSRRAEFVQKLVEMRVTDIPEPPS